MNPINGELSHLLAQAQALSSRIAAVNEIAIAINRSLDLKEILQIVGKKAKWLLDFEHLSIYLLPDQFVTLFGRPVDFDLGKLTPDQAICSALKSRQPQLVREGVPQFIDPYLQGLVMPLENQKQMMGTLNFATTQPKKYTLDDIRIAYLLALQISAAIRNAERFKELNQLYTQLETEKQKSDQLLLNILPVQIADRLKRYGEVKPIYHECVSVLFADFKNFTKLSEILTPQQLFNELHECFCYFDEIIEKYNLEKLKTMGDGYLCAGGIPVSNETHAIDAVLAGLEMQTFMYLLKAHKIESNQPYWDLRVGIHSGPLMAGVIGKKKFAYDIWGDTVNIASRMESSGLPGKVNISGTTFNLMKGFFEAEYRGKIAAKNKGKVDMYLINGIKAGLSIDPGGLLPNQKFINSYLALDSGSNIAPPFCEWNAII